MATVDTTYGTYRENLFIPEVIADIVETKLTDNMVFAPLALIDRTLAAGAGDTVKLPFYSYIGAAVSVSEGHDIPLARLVQSTTSVSVIKIGTAVQITDEAALSAYGNPIEENNKKAKEVSMMPTQSFSPVERMDISNSVAVTGTISAKKV